MEKREEDKGTLILAIRGLLKCPTVFHITLCEIPFI